ncbi:MAG TPA: GtrA family protein [Candidatus Paceibacterota bacterium]|nr:GtrA family protein [Candidatus Paceibacterota bacterium]
MEGYPTPLARAPYNKIVRFAASGGTGAVVHFSVLIFLVERLGIYPINASVIAFLCAFLVSFSLQKFWTFRNFDTGKTTRQASLYFSIALAGLGANAALMYLFIDFAQLEYLVAQALTSGIIAVGNFFLYKHVVFPEGAPPPVV